MDIHKNLVRTWYYLRDIDNNYAGMIRARVKVYEQEGLKPDSHFVASTGIQGNSPWPHALVGLHAHSIDGLEQEQIHYLKALTHLCPTNDYEFDFKDRIHQCTISSDGRHMVFAPMRVLRPRGQSREFRPEEVMRRLQETVVLDSMATLDLLNNKVWLTEIPYPIPAHFELDPFDANVLYVSTHSLVPHSEGVLCFQPGTIHKMRISNGETIIEGAYTHPGFVRTTQHCVFGWNGRAFIAATNQNKLEIIDASTMTLYHVYRLGDDPLYDNADFNDPEFLQKPFNLPPQPAWCDSISASGDGAHLILHLTDGFGIFDMEKREMTGKVHYRSNLVPQFTTTHGRYWMQNANFDVIQRAYAEM